MTAAPSMHTPPAVYLRCYPRDPLNMNAHRAALLGFAARLGLASPVVYFDNGFPGSGNKPRLDDLTRAIRMGRHRVVLLPGLWALSIDHATAQRDIDLLADAGCRRVHVLPPELRPARHASLVTSGPQPAGPRGPGVARSIP
ncbi:hypothetical protein ACWGHM_29365 [Streptomyces sp. NPDC054904]|uniref:hypothetical protein n=1 Tax=Streptomyces sp. Isolate_45 TaxID=2950111 RepID=UPI002481C156|nr:hypothetical protein [Streptomyces sp. Isolate_45]MDA5283710.1 hypothetical protein [Streptomyces sp. Isolate_45]